MRSIAYGVAALAAVGIMIGIVMMPDGQPRNERTVGSQPATEVSSGRVMTEPGTLTLSVPEMHCPFACYPAVKKTLESDDTVSEVELAEQKEEGVIDNRQVIVKYDVGFDLDAAIASLDKRGFANSEIVQ